MSVRTRFAPSPTGYLHVGGARTALFNYLFARKHQGAFILRVEDTDAARNTAEARDAIFSGLQWLGLSWDEGEGIGGPHGPYNQSERNDRYHHWFEVLRNNDRVYLDDGAWRFRFHRTPITMHDLVCGDVTIDYRDESNTPDMVIRRSDGSFVFHFVNVVDDLDMQISHVIRGEDHLMNTPKHLQLFEALGAKPPQYAHIPLILNPNGSKMSKRDQGAALGDYPRQGFLPSAVVNFLALLGWSPKSEEEIFSLDDLVQRFSLETVNRAPARFDPEKCAWVNQQHLTRLSDPEFTHAIKPFVAQNSLPTDTPTFARAAKAIHGKIRLLSEAPAALDFLLTGTFETDPEALAKVAALPDAHHRILQIAQAFAAISDWNPDTAKTAITEVAKAAGAKPGQWMLPVRVALSGRTGGPDLGEIFSILGQKSCSDRLKQFATLLPA